MGWKGENNFSSNVLVAPLKEDNVQQQKALLKLDCQLNLAFMVIFQISALVRVVDCRVGQLFRQVFEGLKLPRTFSFSSLIGLFETLWVTYVLFRPLKVLKIDFYEGT